MPQSEKILRVLSLEGSDPLENELKTLGMNLEYKHVPTLSDLNNLIKTNSWNMVICPFYLGGFTALDALDVIRSHSLELPFVLISDGLGEETVADMMKAGIEDVVMKSRLERLRVVVRRILREQEIKEKEVKAQKIANEAFAAKEQMLAIVSHDIKNPLSALQLEAQMLLKAAEKSKSLLAEEVKIQSNRILKTTERMKSLICDLLDKNKSENSLAQLSKSKVDGIRLLQDVLDSMRALIQEKEIILRLSLPQDALMVIDRHKMSQVFSNLITNALKFTPEGGVIEVGVEESEHEYTFFVDDSGPGLKDKDHSKLFEKYWTGKTSHSSGTGLGLFICKTIIEAHGGQIFAENLEEGARFSFTIPKIHSGDVALREDGRKKIFIVDDDEDLREVMSWALSKEGYAIHSFASPEEALQVLHKGKQSPNLILVDFHMDEMKGSDFVFKKNEILRLKDCPVVMISASPKEVQKEIPMEFYKNVITKPIDLEGLVDNIRTYLN